MPTETPSSGAEVLPQTHEEQHGGEAELERAELPALLRKHSAKQAPESGRLLG